MRHLSKVAIAAAIVGAGALSAGSAQAFFGGPWGGPWGGAPGYYGGAPYGAPYGAYPGYGNGAFGPGYFGAPMYGNGMGNGWGDMMNDFNMSYSNKGKGYSNPQMQGYGNPYGYGTGQGGYQPYGYPQAAPAAPQQPAK